MVFPIFSPLFQPVRLSATPLAKGMGGIGVRNGGDARRAERTAEEKSSSQKRQRQPWRGEKEKDGV